MAMKLNKALVAISLALVAISTMGGDDCTWDTDDADSPDFANRIGDCRSSTGTDDTTARPVRQNDKSGRETLELYEDSEVRPGEITEIPIAARGFDQHTPGQSYAVRAAYSLAAGAKFEDSITLAIHRIHAQMAQYCARGWHLNRQWTATADSPGSYYLHYSFTCTEEPDPVNGK